VEKLKTKNTKKKGKIKESPCKVHKGGNSKHSNCELKERERAFSLDPVEGRKA